MMKFRHHPLGADMNWKPTKKLMTSTLTFLYHFPGLSAAGKHVNFGGKTNFLRI